VLLVGDQLRWRAFLRYALAVQKSSSRQRSPTLALLLGSVVTLTAVVTYSAYITAQLSGLRRLQSNTVERNHKDSLQLLRIENDLKAIALTMGNMLDTEAAGPLSAWSERFDRVRGDLNDALHLEEQYADPTSKQRQSLRPSLERFWEAMERMLALARAGKDSQAREHIRMSLRAEQAALGTAVSRLLIENNEHEQRAADQIARIYDGVQRQVYYFLAATILTIVCTSVYLIRSSRAIFARLAALSEQRSDLAQKLISTQETTLRHVSRELHDEFGQVLTAIGSLLARVHKHTPESSPLREDLQEVREIAQSTLDNIRTLSQALHPVLLDEQGLANALEWYIPTVERQTGLTAHYQKSGEAFAVGASVGVQIYRVLQEALNNVTRHSGAQEVWVRLKFSARALELEVEDRGKGFTAQTAQRGIGLVGMRERAELIGGTLEVRKADAGGTLVHLIVPREKAEAHGE
jgi:signal transduction histidine kinase